jgi:hypothetical protein
MSETYVECLVKGKPSTAAKIFKVVLIIILAALIVVTFLTPYGSISIFIAIVVGAVLYFVNLYTDIEYEYLYLDREITVDRILCKSSRKRVACYNVDRVEIIAPLKSYHLDDYRNRQVKTTDFSAADDVKNGGGCAIYYEGGERILFSPNDEMMKALKNVAPRKVFTD